MHIQPTSLHKLSKEGRSGHIVLSFATNSPQYPNRILHKACMGSSNNFWICFKNPPVYLPHVKLLIAFTLRRVPNQSTFDPTIMLITKRRKFKNKSTKCYLLDLFALAPVHFHRQFYSSKRRMAIGIFVLIIKHSMQPQSNIHFLYQLSMTCLMNYGASFFIELDLQAGYHQVQVHPNDIQKTIFCTL